MFDEIKQMICNYVEVEADKITPDSKFIDDLGFNSFDFVSLLGEVEDKYGIKIDENEILDLVTVQDAIDYFTKLKG